MLDFLLSIRYTGGFYENGCEPSDFIKVEKLFDKMSDCQRLKRDCVVIFLPVFSN
jgi:hypothetical protein